MRVMWTDKSGTVHTKTSEAEGDGRVAFPDTAKNVWLDVLSEELAAGNGSGRAEARSDELDLMRRLFKPHPVAVRRLLETRAVRPSLLAYPDAVVFSIVDGGTGKSADMASPIHVVLGHHFLITAHQTGGDVLDQSWEEVRESGLLEHGPDLALDRLLNRHLMMYEDLRHTLVSDYEDIQRVMLEHPYKNLAHRILDSRRRFLALRRRLGPEQEIYMLLASDHFEFVQDDNRPYLQDLADHMAALVEEVDATRDGLSGTVEAYTSMQSNEINKVMKFLTIISVLSLPATMIASIYGMNFYIPEVHWEFGYWYSLALMGSVTGSLLWYMARRDWFR